MVKRKLWQLIFVVGAMMAGCELQVSDPSPKISSLSLNEELPTGTAGTFDTQSQCDIYGPAQLGAGYTARYVMHAVEMPTPTYQWTVTSGNASFSCPTCKDTNITLASNQTQVTVRYNVVSGDLHCNDAWTISRSGNGPTPGDNDGDGIPDEVDPDDDNDGTPDSADLDDDNDGVPDKIDDDEDNDGVSDKDDGDDDDDEIPDDADEDDNNNGVLDELEQPVGPSPTPCLCPNPKVSIHDPYPSDPNRNCSYTSSGMYSFTVSGTQAGDILQWTGTNANIQNGQGTTAVAAWIPNTSSSFSVACKVTRKCANGTTTYIRTATYSSNISQQCRYFGQSTTGVCGGYIDPD